MTADAPSAGSTGDHGENRRITASLHEEGGQKHFRLVCRGETLVLRDSGALNRWAAIGLTERHNLIVSADGVTIDGKTVHFSDPQAVAELGHIFNASHQAPPAPPEPRMGRHPSHHHNPGEALARINDLETTAERFIVTREGIDFHVIFRTKFGEIKTEKLETALEVFQNLGLLKPHLNLQKIGIRLSVTRWDGESLVEEPGLADLEAATPEDVHALINRFLQGTSGPASVAATPSAPGLKRRVIRLEIVKKSNEFRFHLVFHYPDGTSEDGPLLVRTNLAKLQADGLFEPGIFVSMTVMNDKVIVERGEDNAGKRSNRIEILPLQTMEDVKPVEILLTGCLRGTPAKPSGEPSLDPNRTCPPPTSGAPAPQPPTGPSRAPSAPEKKPIEHADTPEVLRPTTPLKQPLAETLQTEPAPAPSPSPPPTEPAKAEAELIHPEWLIEAWRAVEEMPVETVNDQVFHAVRRAAARSLVTNDHGCPSFTVPFRNKDGSSAELEIVLLGHHLLCSYPFGYLRFGPETRVFLKRLDDFVAFEHNALRGALKDPDSAAFAFVVTTEFMRFLSEAPIKEFKAQFSGWVVPISEVRPKHAVIWPQSREEQIFQRLVGAAETYGLPVESDAIILDPGASEFLGFRRAPPYGIEFRDGSDFVRFTPAKVEVCENGAGFAYLGNAVLRGWALDDDGRVCALYDEQSGFSPPDEVKLLRFLKMHESEDAGLNILACLERL